MTYTNTDRLFMNDRIDRLDKFHTYTEVPLFNFYKKNYFELLVILFDPQNRQELFKKPNTNCKFLTAMFSKR